jgi:cation-transporting ATPase E
MVLMSSTMAGNALVDPAWGLDAAAVAERIARGETNSFQAPASRSLRAIVRANVLTWFNGLLGSLCVVTLALGSYADALFGLIIVINSVIGVVQEVRAKRTLDRLSLVGEAQARVRREGEVLEVDPSEIVLDDVLVVGPGDKIEVDGEVLRTASLEIDEALLTGEPDPVPKAAGDVVMSGSFVASGSGDFRAVRVGAQAYATTLAAEARRFSLVHSELRSGLDRFLRYVTWFLIPTAILLVISQLLSNDSIRGALLGAVAGVVTMVPEGLILLTSIAFALGVIRLGQRRVLVQEMPAIEGLARVDTVCIDKTGTLTEPVISVVDVVGLDGADGAGDVTTVLAALAAADPTPNPSMQAIARRFPDPPGWTVGTAVPFSSVWKWSGVAFGSHGTWVLGAADVLLAENDPASQTVRKHAAAGLRVLLLASATDLGDPEAPVALGVRPVALVLLEQPIRADAAATLDYFGQQGVRVVVLSGDDPRTVGAIAGRLGLPGAGEPYDARELPSDESQMSSVLSSHSVFGRVTPQQKRDVVQVLQSHGHDVAMTGDGVNDVLALKDADIGVAMGNGSPATRSVAQIVLLDSRFADLPTVVAEGRRVLGNIERVASLFLTKTVYACLMALAIGVLRLPFPFLPRHLTLISSLTIGIPGFFLALAPNTARVRTGFVPRVLRFAIPSGLVAGAASLVAYGLARASTATNLQQDRTTAVITLFIVAMWVLGIVARPWHPWTIALLLSMVGLFVLALAVPLSRHFFDLDPFGWLTDSEAALCGVAGVVALEVGWRVTKWVDRHHPHPAPAT